MLKLTLALLLLTISANALTIPATDSKIYYTEYNWYADTQNKYLETANPGAYIKFNFTGTSLKVNIERSLLTSTFLEINWSIDRNEKQNITLPTNGSLPGNNTIVLATGLSSGVTHSLFLYVKTSAISKDRWFTPQARLRILNFVIDDGSSIIAPALAPKRLLFYSDGNADGSSSIGPLAAFEDDEVYGNWAFTLAFAINAELSVVAWSGQGYVDRGSGNVPPLWNQTGGANDSAWKWQDSRHQRSFEKCPDYIVFGNGYNDKDVKAELVITAIVGLLKDVRQTCPSSKVFVVVPFARILEGTIVQAYKNYQAAQPDQGVVLIQLGERASVGFGNGPSLESTNGIHTTNLRSAQLGALTAVKMMPYLATSRWTLPDL